MNAGRRTTSLPRLEQVTLDSFSLYRLMPRVTITLESGIFCLAGANGLGKSSFIAALNYGLTGGVAPPSGRVEQLPKYRRDAESYSNVYFNGRIVETDRKSARISLTFVVGEKRYLISRAFFAPHELATFSVETLDGTSLIADEPAMDAEERHQLYENSLVGDTGLQTFAQFVFLQHFVFSFDEHRHLLFWDARATELVLYLALGLDPGLAKQVDELRKAAAAAGSGARNSQYQATLARNEITALTTQLKSAVRIDPNILIRYRELQSERETVTATRNELRTALSDARLEYAEATALHMRKRQEYEEAFKRRLSRGSGSVLNLIISETLRDHLCRVCGTQHKDGPASVAHALDSSECPLCKASLPSAVAVADNQKELLFQLDKDLSLASTRVTNLSQTIIRLDEETREAQHELANLITQATAIEDRHAIPATSTPTGDEEEQNLRERIRQLESSYEVNLGRKEEQLQLRADALATYEPIQAKLKSAWNAAELEFVPRFRRLAEEFIGLPLQVSLDTGPGISGNAHLALTVNSTHRRRSEQLSESQRFFLDIALRMSLAQHMAGEQGPACLLIDTPEGALDIAYEARAGDMFASFAESGDQIVMTANVNTSQLLTRMAGRCGRGRMKFVRMTDWTTLSDVQIEEDGLFVKAFSDIENALDSGPSTHSATAS